MRNTTMLFLAALTLPTMAGAQQLRPFAVDKTSSQSGLLVYKGVSYVSLNLLLKAGATASKQGLFVYATPVPAGPPLKLAGCLNEKLYDGYYYLTAKAPVLAPATEPGKGATWQIPVLVQPIGDLRIESKLAFDGAEVNLNEALLIYRDGSRFMEKSTPIGTATSGLSTGYYPGKTISQATLSFNKDENEVEANPPVKLVLPQANITYGETYPGFTINLSCSK